MSGGGYKISDQYGLYFLTFTICGWVDVFTRKETKQIIVESLDYCIKNKGLVLYGYVIMTNHIHLIARAGEKTTGLSDIIRDFKKHTSKEIIKWMNESNKESRKEWMQVVFKFHAKLNSNNSEYQIWQQNSHPKIIVQPRFARQKLNYIHYNPVRAGFVDYPEEYSYSSYRNYYEESRLTFNLPIEILYLNEE